ncbi:histidine phosphatase family protein [Kitasatospora sp. NBC_00240]|uniref:SixA phosphatase family protein n=1 Tax=Kitasatospora sp. NBC_00240 TaxID=2903567 RepID=UPI002255E76E|nr:histidine phosphatase family protein [Kitasatospora sp. NBC_00240]MCX5208524.1 histidine phosphatase family protein [Kitasatospora sp. NBC_00240]
MSEGSTRRIVLLRHAKADPKHLTEHPDHERPLTARGRSDAPRTGRWLARSGLALDQVLVSTSVRTRETWELTAAELTGPPPADFEPRLYRAGADELRALLEQLPADAATVLVVGHNPGIRDLAGSLAGHGPEEVRKRLDDSGFHTAGIAVLSFAGSWADLGAGPARLDAYWSPRL